MPVPSPSERTHASRNARGRASVFRVPSDAITTLDDVLPVYTGAATVPADGLTTVCLLDLVFGSRVTITGPDPDVFQVTGDSLVLAFDKPGHDTIVVHAPDGATAMGMRGEAVRV